MGSGLPGVERSASTTRCFWGLLAHSSGPHAAALCVTERVIERASRGRDRRSLRFDIG